MITASMVNDLRKRTWVWMMACKKALEEAWWDEDKAIEVLRKKWESKAAEKSGRETWEWRVFIKTEWNKTAILKIWCETDFVAKNDNIKEFAESILSEALSSWISAASEKSENEIKGLIWKIWENLKVEEIQVIESEVSGSYIHSNWKIWVVVQLTWWSEEIAKDIAMHAAAMSPSYTDPSEVDSSLIDKEKEIWTVQLQNEWKPEQIIGNILIWKEKKFREENALKTQAFVKDNSKTCEGFAQDNWAGIVGFVRIAI